ncbi:putative membrane protein [Collimonas fungivorans]|uniref:Putative membrane protein n=1 Tax=Collimonas fungivorans TaxID=158899 RepID=A0A127PFG1_9BURK|nr:putative membrane protein [Collimonas fungivorans]
MPAPAMTKGKRKRPHGGMNAAAAVSVHAAAYLLLIWAWV